MRVAFREKYFWAKWRGVEKCSCLWVIVSWGGLLLVWCCFWCRDYYLVRNLFGVEKTLLLWFGVVLGKR